MLNEDEENDDIARYERQFQTLRDKVGSVDPEVTGCILLNEEGLKFLNKVVDSDGNTLLMQSVRFGRHDAVDFCLKLDGLDINAWNRAPERASGIAWEKKDYVCLLKLLKADSDFPEYYYTEDVDKDLIGARELIDFTEKRNTLHHLIETGDLQSVQKVTESEKSAHFFSPDHETAVSRAAKNNQFKIYGYLVFIGIKLTSEDRALLSHLGSDIQESLKHSLEEYFIQDENSYLIKILASSKILGEFSDKRRDTINRLFNKLNDIAYTRAIIKVLEYEDIDVIFDFDSEHLDRACDVIWSETHGLTVPEKRRVYIGARKSEFDGRAFSHVAGTLAHELCHMAMEAMYRNEAKPYNSDDVDREREFLRILDFVKSEIKESTGVLHELIGTIFEHYRDIDLWSPELIVRVPHILAKCGEAEGKELLQKSVPKLWEFYSNKVFPECKEYSNPMNFVRPLCSVEHLIKFSGIVKESDRKTSPFKEDMWSFRDYVSRFRNMSIIFSTNTELCALHVYHELKRSHGFHTERQCLLLYLSCFYDHEKQIISAFRCRACNHLALVSNDDSPDLKYLSMCIETVREKEKEVIVILDEKCDDPKKNWDRKVANYDWTDLAENKRKNLLSKEVTFQGKELRLRRLVDEKSAMDFMKPEVLSYILSNENIEIGDERHLFSPGYDKQLFVKRSFFRFNAKNVVKNVNTGKYYLFITGLSKTALLEKGIDGNVVQEMERGEELKKGKLIAVPKGQGDAEAIFKEISVDGNRINEDIYWIHYCSGDFYWRRHAGENEEMDMTFSGEILSEETLLTTAHQKKERVVLVSGDPGTGKSTVTTDLTLEAKKKWPDAFVCRVNLNDCAFAKDKSDLSLDCIDENFNPEDMLKYFTKILRLKNPLERSLLEIYRNIPCRCRVFMDGFDEIAPRYEKKTIRLLRSLLKHTQIQLWVTTRNHECMPLETALDVVSFSMEGITSRDKIAFLSAFWKKELESLIFRQTENEVSKAVSDKITAIADTVQTYGDLDLVRFLHELRHLIAEGEEENERTRRDGKSEKLRQGIAKLNFQTYAEIILSEFSSVISDSKKPFTDIPLHLSMLANILFEENLKLHGHLDIGSFYSKFVAQKFRIHCMHTGSLGDGKQADQNMYDILRNAYRETHMEISERILDHEVCSLEDLKKMDAGKYVLEIGLVRKMAEHYEFVHLTFAEFFYCERIFKAFESGTMDGRTLEKIFSHQKYSKVLKFCDAALNNPDAYKSARYAEIECWNAAELLRVSISKAEEGDLSGMHLLRCLLEDRSTVDDFSFAISNHYANFMDSKLSTKLLSVCMNSDICYRLFDSDFILKTSFATNAFAYFDGETALQLLNKLRRGYPESKGADGSKIRERRMRFLDARDNFGRNILFCAARSEDTSALIELLRFMNEYRGKELTERLLLESNSCSIVDLISYNGRNFLNTLKEIESVTDKDTVVKMLAVRDMKGLKLVHGFALGRSSGEFDGLMEWLIELCGGELPDEMKLESDEDGRSIWHRAALTGGDFASETENVRKWWDRLSAGEEMRESIMRGDKHGDTVFHVRAILGIKYMSSGEGDYFFRDLISLEPILGREDFVSLLTRKNVEKETCLHISFKWQTRGSIVGNLSFVSELLDGNSLASFLSARDMYGNTLLHNLKASAFYGNVNGVLNLVKEMLDEVSVENLSEMENVWGKKVGIEYRDEECFLVEREIENGPEIKSKSRRKREKCALM